MSSDIAKGNVFSRIREFIIKLRMEYNSEFHVILYTSIGRIVCDLEPPATKNSVLGFVDDPTTLAVDFSAIFDGTNMFDQDLVNAKNVVIYKNNSDEVLMNVEQMIIFADQILGFTLVRDNRPKKY